jgi:hypothetical protein
MEDIRTKFENELEIFGQEIHSFIGFGDDDDSLKENNTIEKFIKAFDHLERIEDFNDSLIEKNIPQSIFYDRKFENWEKQLKKVISNDFMYQIDTSILQNISSSKLCHLINF